MLWPQLLRVLPALGSRVRSASFTLTLALISLPATNGIVIATEKKSSSILIDESMLDKVSVVCPNIGIVYSGMGPDFRVLVAKARKSAQAYWKVYGEYPPTRILTQELANVMQQATQSGSVVPLGMNLYLTVPTDLTAVSDHMVFHCLWRAGIRTGDPAYIKSTLPVRSGRGRPAPSVRTW
jgi:hypothetical protein